MFSQTFDQNALKYVDLQTFYLEVCKMLLVLNYNNSNICVEYQMQLLISKVCAAFFYYLISGGWDPFFYSD